MIFEEMLRDERIEGRAEGTRFWSVEAMDKDSFSIEICRRVCRKNFIIKSITGYAGSIIYSFGYSDWSCRQ